MRARREAIIAALHGMGRAVLLERVAKPGSRDPRAVPRPAERDVDRRQEAARARGGEAHVSGPVVQRARRVALLPVCVLAVDDGHVRWRVGLGERIVARWGPLPDDSEFIGVHVGDQTHDVDAGWVFDLRRCGELP